MAMKISDAMIALVIVGGFVTLLVMVLASGATTYSTKFDSSKYSSFNSTINNVSALASQESARTANMSAQSGLIDWLGGLFSQSFAVMQITAQSAGIFNQLINTGLYSIGLNDAQIMLLAGVLVTIVLILITFTIIRMVTKEQG